MDQPDDPLTGRILNWAAAHSPRRSHQLPTAAPPVAPGQIRRLDGAFGPAGNRADASILAIVLAVDPTNGGAAVAVLITSWERATDRDILVGPINAGLPYEAVVLSDIQATVFMDQMAANPILGEVPREIRYLVATAPGTDTELLAERADALDVPLGSGRALPGSVQWLERQRAADLLGAIATDYTDPPPVFLDPVAVAPPLETAPESVLNWTYTLEYAIRHRIPTFIGSEGLEDYLGRIRQNPPDREEHLGSQFLRLMQSANARLVPEGDEDKIWQSLLDACMNRTPTVISDRRGQTGGLQFVPGRNGEPRRVNIVVPREVEAE